VTLTPRGNCSQIWKFKIGFGRMFEGVRPSAVSVGGIACLSDPLSDLVPAPQMDTTGHVAMTRSKNTLRTGSSLWSV
jgi:hypothetical protein